MYFHGIANKYKNGDPVATSREETINNMHYHQDNSADVMLTSSSVYSQSMNNFQLYELGKMSQSIALNTKQKVYHSSGVDTS